MLTADVSIQDTARHELYASSMCTHCLTYFAILTSPVLGTQLTDERPNHKPHVFLCNTGWLQTSYHINTDHMFLTQHNTFTHHLFGVRVSKYAQRLHFCISLAASCVILSAESFAIKLTKTTCLRTSFIDQFPPQWLNSFPGVAQY